MNEDLKQYLDSLTPEQTKEILGRVGAAQTKAKSFWRRLYDAKKTGWNEDASKFFSDLAYRHESPEKDILSIDGVPSYLSQKQVAPKKAKTPPQIIPQTDPFLEKIRKGFTEEYNIPDSQAPVSPVEDLEPLRDSFKQNYNEAYRTKDNASKAPQKAPTKVQRVLDKPIEAPDRENPNDKALESFKKELAETLGSFGNERLKESVSSWNKTKEDNATDLNLQKRERINNFLNDFKDTLGPLYDTFQFIEQRKQEKEAMRVADRAGRQAPSAPAVRGENRILSNLIRTSQLANANPEQQLQPFKDQTNLAYQQDLTSAQELSGGQAGNALGLSQAAAIRRGRANEQLAPMAGDIYRKGLETTGALVGQQMQDDTWRDQQNIDIWRTRATNNLDLQKQAGIGAAMSRGRSIQARNNMYDSLLNSPVFDVETYMNMTKGNLQAPTPTI
jgi:hypothetical protein